jgi:hypothetical protein
MAACLRNGAPLRGRRGRSNGMLLLAPADWLRGAMIVIKIITTEMKRRTANGEDLPVARPIN